MNTANAFKKLLKLCGLIMIALLMVFGAFISCGIIYIKEKAQRDAIAQKIKESNEILMLQSDDSSYKRCFKFDKELYATGLMHGAIIFYFNNFSYISGTEKSPSKPHGPPNSSVTIGIFGKYVSKKNYINSYNKQDQNKQATVIGKYQELLLYEFSNNTYSAMDKNDIFVIEYKADDGRPRNKEERIRELKLIVDFIESHTIPCQGES
ncbi:hypothetical protein [Xylella fastidiosa]|uniref:hypothetical protein n=1 Tax=Xylella fastidiosa TaxID=2371 RepID=UPI00111CE4A7|nr:hypothetical protein [Xylella fastidiosa]TNW22972.1 hypothetical protein EIP73_08880 [Xylella fastidiosa subsp. pauca]